MSLHIHTPKMSDRKKGLFPSEKESTRESLTKHRNLPVVDSESDSEDCDLGIISTLDFSSGEDNDVGTPRTPNRTHWHETRSHTKRIMNENQSLKNFMKSPFTLKKYQTRHSCPEPKCSGSVSTPVTPHFHRHPGTPSSTHSCASVHTTSSTSSRARKSLASLIADTESCSSSLKDLNFDTDSGTDSKENTPLKSSRRLRKLKTPQTKSFKGILDEQKTNIPTMKTAVVCLTKLDMNSIMSPTQMLKTPHNTIDSSQSPPKLHNRRSVVEIDESPESTCDSEKSHKRLRNDSITDSGPTSKYPRIDNTVPKARLSLFSTDRLKEILSAKSFYGKNNPELNTNITKRISKAIEVTNTHHRRHFSHSHSTKRKRQPGQINMGVRHRIRKPKIHRNYVVTIKPTSSYKSINTSTLNSTISTTSAGDKTIQSLNSTQDFGFDKTDPFGNEKETIEALLSQWTEEEEPESELTFSKPKDDLPCFNSSVIEETNSIFQPVRAVPVPIQSLPQENGAVIVELMPQSSVSLPMCLPVEDMGNSSISEDPGNSTQSENSEPHDVPMFDLGGHKENHGEFAGQFLPVEGGFIYVDDNATVLEEPLASDKSQKLFPIFCNPNPGTSTPTNKGASDKTKKSIIKNGSDQYVIDAGQNKFGATQCNECGVIYQIGDPQDEHDHLVHHDATDVLRFNGWKEECVVERFGSSRCIRVRGGDAGWKKVASLLARVVHPHLGYPPELPEGNQEAYTAYLYIEKKQIVGCLVLEPKTKAYKLLQGDLDCCSIEEYPVKCGVSRIWTHKNFRRLGIAKRLVDCARATFLYGTAILPQDLAFSAPTAAGKAFATNYCGTPNFYVYID